MQSTKAAVEEGIVPGGGVALLNAQAALDKVDLEGDELTGAAIVRKALEEPLKQIAHNAGLEGGVVVEKVRALDPGGLNAATGEYVDMIKSGVVDPAKVTRSALQNAASIAALFLTTEAVVAEKPEKDAGRAGHAGRRRHGLLIRVILAGIDESDFRNGGLPEAPVPRSGAALRRATVSRYRYEP